MLQLSLALVLATASGADVDVCAIGDGVVAKQPGSQSRVTCAPPSSFGSGEVRLEVDAAAPAYLDAQVFSYPPPRAATQHNIVNIAALALGSDGGCGAPPPPSTPDKHAATIMDYLHRAGTLKADLAVLPENAFGQPAVPDPGCYRKAEPIDGPIVTSVRAVAAQHRMNIILPIHEARGGAAYNTAVVIDRDGEVVGTYSKVFPVFGNASQTVPPNTASGASEVAGPGSVLPAPSGVKAFDLDFGRVAVLT